MTHEFGTKVFRRHPEVAFTRFGEEMLVVVPRGSWQLVLNGTGARVFELLDGQQSVEAIARQLVSEYEGVALEEAQADVLEVLDDLVGKGAVEQL